MRGRETSPETRFLCKVGAAVFVALFVLVWENVEGLRLEKTVKGMRREVDLLTYENGLMQMQVHHWVSPSRLEDVARKEYGMLPLDAAHVIGINPK